MGHTLSIIKRALRCIFAEIDETKGLLRSLCSHALRLASSPLSFSRFSWTFFFLFIFTHKVVARVCYFYKFSKKQFFLFSLSHSQNVNLSARSSKRVKHVRELGKIWENVIVEKKKKGLKIDSVENADGVVVRWVALFLAIAHSSSEKHNRSSERVIDAVWEREARARYVKIDGARVKGK